MASVYTYTMADKEQTAAIFAGGCFWCTESVFLSIRGVDSVVSGYTGGNTPDPTYEDVCSGSTGHAEAVMITYDLDIVTYRILLDIFFYSHDPTTLNRQGADVGTQYRSAIFPVDDDQERIAREYIHELETSGGYHKPIVTTVEPFTTFYPAEGYHQKYYERNGGQPYCSLIISPKLTALKQRFKKYFVN